MCFRYKARHDGSKRFVRVDRFNRRPCQKRREETHKYRNALNVVFLYELALLGWLCNFYFGLHVLRTSLMKARRRLQSAIWKRPGVDSDTLHFCGVSVTVKR